ncbi:glycosyltransferase 87 family protein [Asticcacaulis sp. EMRT-3]|uniref:glycosyltransferase 87 family protein n=1 Tax=Asticcacaulis sp. EMRT-3 TaxID=3040349 RepID=UPI0024AFE0E1|nr:glycosyltransferase 87 family protein [Asticcacaulis sp. EMRT-3]MDI7774224.1 glycosyltransferase 87 family protein [Asticcacaulis sp. EMRT-3]
MIKSDAVAFIEGHSLRPWGRVVFYLLCLFPALGNLVSRIIKHGWWLNDFDALICGADHVRRGLSPYDLHPVCTALRPAVYVYAPQVAKLFAPLAGIGLIQSRWLWLIALLPALAFLLWYALIMPLAGSPWRLRLMSFSAMAGSALVCGNIGFILHAMIIAAALNLKRARWPFVAAVILAALVKPVMLTYLIVLALDNRPWRARIFATFGASTLGLAAVAAEMLTAGSLSANWHQTLGTVVMAQQPGIGYFAWASWLGLSPYGWLTLTGLALYMAVICLAGLCLAESRSHDHLGRIIIGLGVAQLLNPRLMDYDMLALAPFMALVVMMAKPLGERFFTAVSWAFAGVLIFALALNIFEVPGLPRAPVCVLAYAAITVCVAARLAARSAWLAPSVRQRSDQALRSRTGLPAK